METQRAGKEGRSIERIWQHVQTSIRANVESQTPQRVFLYPYLDSREHALDMFKINNNMFRTGQDKPKHFLDIWNILNKNLFF